MDNGVWVLSSLSEENFKTILSLAFCCRETTRARPWMEINSHAKVSRLLIPLVFVEGNTDGVDDCERWSPDRSDELVEYWMTGSLPCSGSIVIFNSMRKCGNCYGFQWLQCGYSQMGINQCCCEPYWLLCWTIGKGNDKKAWLWQLHKKLCVSDINASLFTIINDFDKTVS